MKQIDSSLLAFSTYQLGTKVTAFTIDPKELFNIQAGYKKNRENIK